MDHFNTTHLKGEQLKQANEEAKTIKEKVLNAYRKIKQGTSSDIYNYLKGEHPVQSIRPRTCTLCDEGFLVKTPILKTGIYGKSEHVYKLV